MRKSAQLIQQYEELNTKYEKLFAEKAEAEYAYRKLKEETEARNQKDEEIRSLHQNIRKLKHDMKNHFMMLASYLASEEYASAKAYASEILDKLNTMNSYVETGNSLMNYIVNEKLQAAREQGIRIKAEIENLAFARMKSMDFSALLTNLLDNALEACLRENQGMRELSLTIARKQGYEAVCVKNKIEHSVLEKNPDLQSVKEDAAAHGIGILRVKEIVEAYNGIYDIYEEDGFFCVSVFIPQ